MTVLALLLFATASVGTIYSAIATAMTWRFLHRAPAAPTSQRAVTLLRPMHGAEPELDESLASLAAQAYAGPLQVILGVSDASDPAFACARAFKAANPKADIVLLADATAHGTNRKLGNLINMSAAMTGDIVVISDSDVRLPPGALSAFVETLQQPGVGLVYGLYRGRPAGNLWSRIAALDVNARFAPSVVVGQALGAHPVLGPTMALRAGVLERIGGFERLKDVLADDFELGRLVREQGFTIACPPLLIDHVFPERTLGDVWTHELRWARTIRLLNPAGYGGSAITYVLPIALLGAALAGFAPWAVVALGLLTMLRLAQCAALCAVMRADFSALWLFMARDLLSFGVFLAAWFGNRIEWRGHRLRVQADGAMASS